MKLNPKKATPIAIAALVVISLLVWREIRYASLPYAGTLEATRIDLPARVSTVVQSIEVSEGQHVEKGQKLLSLACDEVRLAARLAQDNYDRGVKLRKAGGVSEEAYAQIQNRQEDAAARLSWCDLVSPISGTVLTRYLEPAEWVNPGTKLLTIADLQDIWAYVYVPQSVMSQLKVGQEVRGIVPELHRREFKGVIRKINDEAEFTPKNVQTRAERTRLVFGVKVAFTNTDGTLKPGMTLEMDLPTE